MGAVLILLSALIYSFTGIFSRMIGFHLPIFYQIWTRGIASIIILTLIVAFFKQWSKFEHKDYLWLFLRAISGIIAFICFFISVNNLTLGSSYFIFYSCSTVGGYLLGNLLFKEKFTKIKVFSLFLALAGLFLVYSANFDPQKIIYLIIAAISGLTTSSWNTLSKKVSAKYSVWQLSLTDNILNFIFCFTLSIIIGETWVRIDLSTPWLGNFLMLLAFLITGILMIYGFKYLDAQIASLLLLSEIIFAIILGFVVYGEVISLATFLGGIIIISGIILPEINNCLLKKKFS